MLENENMNEAETPQLNVGAVRRIYIFINQQNIHNHGKRSIRNI